MNLRTAVLLVAVVMTAFVQGWAQIDTGSIVGSVTDTSGAVVTSATLTVTNQATHTTQSVNTNAQGQYQVLALIPGAYSLTAKAVGFAPQTFANVRIDVQSRVALNIKLKIGTDEQQVVVSETETQLETQSADLGTVVDTRTINELPLNGRNYAQLALLEAGVNKYYSGPNETADRFSVNGNSELSNFFALDGVDNNSNSTNLEESTTQAVQPPPDALEEFRVQTRVYSGEFGNSAGGVVNASIKSGTNQFHGDVWDYLRNEAFDANNFFDKRRGNPRAPLKQNQFGGTIGGPIYRNRTFFFGDFQEVLIHTRSTQTSTVPTLLMKGKSPLEPGVFDFKELNMNGAALRSIVPGQGNCFNGTQIVANCLDPVGVKLLQAYPDPNIPSEVSKAGIANSFGNSNYQYIVATPNTTWSMDSRVDHMINEKNRVYGRYSYFHSKGVNPQWTADPVIGSSNFAADTRTHGQSAVASWIYTRSSSQLNELRFGANRILAANDPPGNLPLGQSDAGKYGLTGVPVSAYTYGLPPISVAGLQTLGGSSWRPQHQVSQVWQLLDDYSWLHGRHSLKFGYQYHRMTNSFLDIQSPQGSMGASGQYSSNQVSGATDLLLGNMNSASYESVVVPHLYQPGHSWYAQDVWRVNDKLTLTAGLRYELYAPLLERDHKLANFSPANGGAIVTANPKDNSWYGKSMVHPDLNDFAPRLGFSYQVEPKLVLRGGYGMFYQHRDRFGSESILSLNAPFVVQASLSQANGSTTPAFVLQNGFPGSSLVANAGVLPPLYTLQIRGSDPNMRTSYVSQASFGTQLLLAPQTTFSLDYVGNFGRKMGRIVNADQAQQVWNSDGSYAGAAFQYQNLINWSGVGVQNPHWFTQSSFLEYMKHDGNTNFNSLQAALHHNMSHGIQYGASYTWSHSIADFNVPINGNYVGQNAYWNRRGERSDQPLDVRQRFSGNLLFKLPFGEHGRFLRDQRIVKNVVDGWQVNTIVSLQTGNPFTIYGDQGDMTGNHDGYADCIGDPFKGATTDPHRYVVNGGGFFINPASFGNPGDHTEESRLGPAYAYGHFGTCRPYSVHGPGFKNTDMSLFRSFQVRESVRVEFRAEAFNVWNNVNFAAPYGYIGNATAFGTVSGTVGSPRNLQFALKIFY